MTMLDKIEKEKQLIARCEKSLALEKLKKRKADTRRKIELGGLVIKAGMDGFNKALILGAMIHAITLIDNDPQAYESIFKAIGERAFNIENVRC
jgi:hypothetical protein